MAKLFDIDNVHETLTLPFPASTKQAAGIVSGVLTDVMSISFSDKIILIISQKGQLSHWLQVPLENINPGTTGFHTFSDASDDSLLPLTGLTATTLLGGHAPGHDTLGQLYARQIASAIIMKTPHEKRVLVMGLGLSTCEPDRDVFATTIDIVLRCI